MPNPFVVFLGLLVVTFVAGVVRHGRRVRAAAMRRFSRRWQDVRQLVEGGRGREAAELLEKIIDDLERHRGPLDPSLSEPLFRLGLLRAQEDHMEEAEALLDRAATLARRGAPGARGVAPLADVLCYLGWVLLRAERFAEARARCEEAIREGREEVEVVGVLAAACQGQGDLAEAERWYRQALVLDAGPPEGAARAASAYRLPGVPAAVEGPSAFDILIRLGWLAAKRGATGQAEEDYRRALSIAERAEGPQASRIAEVLDPLVRLLTVDGRLGEAVATARRLVDLTKEDPVAGAGAGTRLGDALCEAGDLDEATAVHALSVARLEGLPEGPALGRALYGQGLCFLAAGDRKLAEPALSRAAGLVVDAEGVDRFEQAVFLNALAYVRAELGLLPEAARDALRALSLADQGLGANEDAPEEANLLDTLAEIRRRQGRLLEARSLAERALRVLRPGDREGLDGGLMRGTLARVLRDEGRRAEALAEQERALAVVERCRGRGWRWRKLRDDFER